MPVTETLSRLRKTHLLHATQPELAAPVERRPELAAQVKRSPLPTARCP